MSGVSVSSRGFGAPSDGLKENLSWRVGRREFGLGLGAALLMGGCAAPTMLGRTSTDEVLLFAYFMTGKGEGTGLKLAVSEDGFAFRTLAEGRSFLVPAVGEARLMRDPFLFRGEGADTRWHLLWTTAWEGGTIGHATSADLRSWSPQRALPVMANVPGTRNCWAPEAIWDRASRSYMLFWSSTVAGRYQETAGSSESGYNHRLWRTTTQDFERFTPAEPLYDPGFSVIDGTFARGASGELYLIVKDETRFPPRKMLQAARASSPTGPFSPLSPPFTPAWVEGPMTTRVGDRTICYYDVYRDGRWGAMATRDFDRWEDVSATLRMPPGARHGSLIRVPRAIAERLEAEGPVA